MPNRPCVQALPRRPLLAPLALARVDVWRDGGAARHPLLLLLLLFVAALLVLLPHYRLLRRLRLPLHHRALLFHIGES
tara:strand:- start:113 stop:346 length:234 start_codon:yes stop_codon:yes gene_type:complete